MAGAYPPLILNLSARLDGSVAASFAQFERSGVQSAQRVSVSLASTGREANNVADKMRIAASAARLFEGGIGGLASRLSASGELFRTTSTIFATALAAAAGGGAIIKALADVQNLQARLRSLSGSQEAFTRAQADTLKIARDSRSNIDDTIKLYSRLLILADQFGISQKRIGTFTRVVQTTQQLQGLTGYEANLSNQEIAHAFDSDFKGVGQQLRQLSRESPLLLNTIVEGLGNLHLKGYAPTIEGMRAFAKQGKLSSELVAQAVESMQGKVQARLNAMDLTLTQASNNLKTSLTSFYIKLEESTGVASGTASAIDGLSRHLGDIGGALALAGAAITGKFLGPMIASGVTSVRAGVQIASTAAGFGTAATAAAAFGEQQLVLQGILTRGNIPITQQAALIEALGVAFATASSPTEVFAAAEIALRDVMAAAAIPLAQQTILLSELSAAETSAVGTLSALEIQQQALAEIMTLANIPLAEQAALLLRLEVATGTAATGVLALDGVVAATAATAATLGAALKGLVTFVGGPFGVAIIAAGGLLYLLSTREDLVASGAERAGLSQDEFAKHIAATTGVILQQNDALKKNYDLTSNRGVQAANADLAGRTSDVQSNQSLLANTIQILGKQAESDGKNAFAIRAAIVANNIRRGESIQKVRDDLDHLQGLAPEYFKPNKMLGYDFKTDANRTLDQLAAAVTSRTDATKRYAEALEAVKHINDPKMKGGSEPNDKEISVLVAKDKALVDAIDASTPALVAAKRRHDYALAQIDADYKIKGKIAPEAISEYEQKRTAVERAYGDEVAAIKSGVAATRAALAQGKRDRAADNADKRDKAREAAEIEREGERLRAFINKDKNQTNRQKALLEEKDLQGLIAERAAHGSAAKPFSTAELAEYRKAINDNITKPMREADAAYAEQLSIQQALLAGDQATAEALKVAYEYIKKGVDLQDIDLQKIRGRILEEKKITDEVEKRNQLVDVYVRTAGQIQGEFTKLFAGEGIISFAKNIQQTLRNAFAEQLSIKIFGDKQKEVSDDLKGANKANADNIILAVDRVRDAFNQFHSTGPDGLSGQVTTGLTDASKAFATNPGLGGGAANDNFSLGSGIVPNAAGSFTTLTAGLLNQFGKPLTQSASALTAATDEIAVTGKKTPASAPADNMDFAKNIDKIGSKFGDSLDKLFGSGKRNEDGTQVAGSGRFSKIGGALGEYSQGASYGALGNSALQSIGLEKKNSGSATGAAVGGAIGAAIGSFIPGIGTLLGSVVGTILGGLVGGLFGKAPRAFYDIKTDSTGAGVVSNPYARGDNQTANLSAAHSEAYAVTTALTALATGLHGNVVGGKSLGAIGLYDSQYSFDPVSGSGNRQNFATEQEAVAAALRNAVQTGAIDGLRAGTKNLILAAGDFQTQVNKANEFNGVFADLKKATDPVGAAVDDVNTKFQHLKAVFAEAGASASDYASLQQLYDLQRAAALNTAQASTVSTLKDYLSSLTTSASNGLSARDRQSAALTAFTPFQADISNGKSVNQDQYKTAADNLLAVDREIYGSTQAYFDRLKQITDLTQAAITTAGGNTSTVSSIADALVVNPNAAQPTSNVTPITDGLTSLQNSLFGQGVISIGILNEIAGNLANGGFYSANQDGIVANKIYAQRNF